MTTGPERALDAAARVLAARDRSAAEVRTRLGDLGFTAAEVEAAIDACRERRWIDDAELAVRLAERAASEGYAPAAVVERLSARGIDADAARRAAHSACRFDEVVSFARACVARARDPAEPGRARRLASLLARRGHDEDTIDRVLAAVGVRAAPETGPEDFTP